MMNLIGQAPLRFVLLVVSAGVFMPILSAENLFDLIFDLNAEVLSFMLGGKKSKAIYSAPRAQQKNGIAATQEKPVVFNDIIGIDPIIEDIKEMVMCIKSPERYRAVGASVPKGVLLEGPPGTGKTMIAKAIANEAGCAFIQASASSFVEVFVGVGASRVRELFSRAKQYRPCIIFIDELDAIGAVKRDADTSGEYRQTLNELLCQLDGFVSDGSVIVIAATNMAESLDPALKRSGRFDRIISVPLPNMQARCQLFQHYLTKLPLAPDITSEMIYDMITMTGGFSGADIKNLANQAAILAARDQTQKTPHVSKIHLEQALNKIYKERSASSFVYGNTTKFKDIIGLDEQLSSIKSMVKFIKNPELCLQLGATIPRGILLEGPPGNGKTMIAKALAHEARCTFMYVSASEFIKKHMGDGALQIRQLFKLARQASPTILFIDELDAIGAANRNSAYANEEYRTTLDELLCQLDGFHDDASVVVMGATNLAMRLDPALKRSGRFDRIITVPLPNAASRAAILKYYRNKLPRVITNPLESTSVSDAYLNEVSLDRTEKFCCADLNNVATLSARVAAEQGSTSVERKHFDQAIAIIKKEHNNTTSFSDLYINN